LDQPAPDYVRESIGALLDALDVHPEFLRAVMEHGRENLAKYKVADIVNKDEGAKVLNTVEKDEIMERILDRNFLCVVDDRDCFIGIITRKSIILYLKN
jgi:predicted transcriptional regulator